MQTVTQKTRDDTMYYNKIPVFTYSINYPFFTTTCSASAGQRVNEHYDRFADSTEEYCRTVLYPQALQSARYLQSDRPFNSYTLVADYTITYNNRCITSLFTDTYTYMGGAHGETKRTSDTWSFITGLELQLNDIYTLTTPSLLKLQNSIDQQVTDRLTENPGSYFENYKDLVRDTFNPDNFYLLPGNYAVYYQQYDIAPYSTGLPEFSFPLFLD